MKTSDSIYSLDTNILVRFLTQDNEELSAKAEAIMRQVFDGRLTVSCDPVILAEVVWVVSSFYGGAKGEIVENLVPIVATDNFLVSNKPLYLLALRIYGSTKAHFADACACAAAILNCGGNLLSFDRDLSSVPGIIRAETV